MYNVIFGQKFGCYWPVWVGSFNGNGIFTQILELKIRIMQKRNDDSIWDYGKLPLFAQLSLWLQNNQRKWLAERLYWEIVRYSAHSAQGFRQVNPSYKTFILL